MKENCAPPLTVGTDGPSPQPLPVNPKDPCRELGYSVAVIVAGTPRYIWGALIDTFCPDGVARMLIGSDVEDPLSKTPEATLYWAVKPYEICWVGHQGKVAMAFATELPRPVAALPMISPVRLRNTTPPSGCVTPSLDVIETVSRLYSPIFALGAAVKVIELDGTARAGAASTPTPTDRARTLAPKGRASFIVGPPMSQGFDASGRRGMRPSFVPLFWGTVMGLRSIGSVVRALASHARGHWFESSIDHRDTCRGNCGVQMNGETWPRPHLTG